MLPRLVLCASTDGENGLVEVTISAVHHAGGVLADCIDTVGVRKTSPDILISVKLIRANLHLLPISKMPSSFRGNRSDIVAILVPIDVCLIPGFVDSLNFFPLCECVQASKLPHHCFTSFFHRFR